MDDDSQRSTRSRSIPEDESFSDGSGNITETQSQADDEDDPNALVLDPKHSQRQYWYEIRTKIWREIWRPGDGDGDRATDYFDKVDPPKKTEDRWKLYQLTLGPIKHNHNEPPKYVLLDDRAAFEIIKSDIPRTSLGKFWPHDFGLSGKIRDRRPHRGRGSVGDPDAEGNDQYDFSYVGMKNVRYYFTGEKDYAPVIYSSEELSAEIAKNLEKKRKGWSVRNKDGKHPKEKGHNQFTPQEWLVKNGAPSKSTTKSKKKKKSLADHKVPEWLLDQPERMDEAAGPHDPFANTPGDDLFRYGATRQPGGFDERQAKKRKLGTDEILAVSSPGKLFPAHYKDTTQQVTPSGFNYRLPPNANTHDDANCPYTESRSCAAQLEKDLATAHDIISEQKGKIMELERINAEQRTRGRELGRLL